MKYKIEFTAGETKHALMCFGFDRLMGIDKDRNELFNSSPKILLKDGSIIEEDNFDMKDLDNVIGAVYSGDEYLLSPSERFFEDGH